MRTITTICDKCGKDLSVTESPRNEYMVVVSSSLIRNTSPYRYAIDMPPPIQGEKHFCGRDCLIAALTEGLGQ